MKFETGDNIAVYHSGGRIVGEIKRFDGIYPIITLKNSDGKENEQNANRNPRHIMPHYPRRNILLCILPYCRVVDADTFHGWLWCNT